MMRRASVNVTQAALMAGVTRKTVYAWVKLGRLETWRTPSRKLRIYVDALVREDEDALTGSGMSYRRG
jgi:excisionase family DNA binding protein